MTSNHPDISVIVPAYYSTHTLRKCLAALQSQTFETFEIILVNSSQETETERIVSEFPLNIEFIQSERRLFPHGARNIGLLKARGELIVFTDPDCTANLDWLENLWRLYRSEPGVIVGGMDHHPRDRLATGIHLCKYHAFLPGLVPGPRLITPTANTAYPKNVLEKTGLFDGSIFAGDALLAWNAHNLGIKIRFEPQATVVHDHSESWEAFLRQRYRRGAEFAETRIAFESWTLMRKALTFLLFPWLSFLVLFRAWRDCCRSRMSEYFWKTFHVQWAGHFFWSLGEASTQWKLLTCKIRLFGKR